VHGKEQPLRLNLCGYDGHTVALLTLERDQVRPLQTNDIPMPVNWLRRDFLAKILTACS